MWRSSSSSIFSDQIRRIDDKTFHEPSSASDVPSMWFVVPYTHPDAAAVAWRTRQWM